jgi:glycosyltransferase involved in cell wall biosynthesis
MHRDPGMEHGATKPAVSIVIPLYNRQDLVGRTIDSCLAQTFPDFEIVVVDDCSTDQSLDVVRRYTDPRVRLVVHEANRGVCPTRNTGADAARAEWLMMLDSDDELLPNAVALLVQKTLTIDPDVGCVYFRCLMDDGVVSPGVEHLSGCLGYEEYLRYIEACTGGPRDLLYCPRKSTFRQIRFPDNFGLEDQYHFDFSRMFHSLMCKEIVRLYHQDAADSLVKRTKVFDPVRDARFVRDRAENIAGTLRGHLPAFRAYAPSLLAEYESRLLTLWLLCGERGKAAEALCRLTRYPADLPRHGATFAIGLFEPRLLAVVRSWVRRARGRLVGKPSNLRSTRTCAASHLNGKADMRSYESPGDKIAH